MIEKDCELHKSNIALFVSYFLFLSNDFVSNLFFFEETCQQIFEFCFFSKVTKKISDKFSVFLFKSIRKNIYAIRLF